MRKHKLHTLLLLTAGLLSLGLFLLSSKPALAANPTSINFQGKVVNANGTNVTDGTYSFVFRIYNTSSPTMTTSCTSTASCLWQETQASVQVTSGVFQVELGSACALTSGSCNNSTGGPIPSNWSNSSLYLTMQFNGDTSGSNGGFMSPIIHLTSVPFAFNSDNLGGLPASNFVQLAQGLQADSSTTNASIAINKTGSTANILTLQKSGKNTLVVDNSGTTFLGQAGASGLDGTLTFNNSVGSNTVSFSLQANPGSSYTLLLPTTGPSTSQCLQTDSTTANQLKFASCAGGSITLASSYNSSGTSGNSIVLSNSGQGVILQDAASSTIVNLFAIQSNGGSSTYIAVTAANSGSIIVGSAANKVTIASGSISTSSGDLTVAAAGTTTVGNGSGAININAGSGAAVSITGHANSTWSLDSGNLTIDVTSGSTPSLSIGTGGQNKTISIGNSQTSTAVNSTAGNTTANLTNTGYTITSNNNNAGAFSVKNSSSATLLNVDASGGNASNLVANPSFETTITGSGAGVWVLKGSASAPTNNTSQFYNQLNSARVITTSAASDGIKQQLNSTLSTSTPYNVLFYAKLDVASAAFTDMQAGFSKDGVADDTPCTLNAAINASGWTKYICTFTTPSSGINSSNYFYIKQVGGAVHTFYIDSVLLQASTTADSNYRDAKLSINATITSSLILQGNTNSTSAFTIQNANGGQVFNVDTTDTNLLNNPANPSFEVNTTGWTTVVPSGSVTINRDTSQAKFGLASLSLTTGAVSGQGVRYTLASGSWPAGSYMVSFSVINTGTAFSAIPKVVFGNGSDNACSAATPSTVPSTAAWMRYSAACTFSGTTTSIAIEQNEATAHTWYIDAVQLETGSTATAYGLGQISFSGVINSPVTFKNQSDSAIAFQIQNSSTLNVLTVDNLNKIIQIGSSTTDANAFLLALDSYNNATDPATGVNGGMYYNSATGTFRCYQGSAWRNCLGGGPSNQSTATQAPTAGSDTYLTGSLIPLPTGGLRGPTGSAQDGSKITWRIVVSKTAVGTVASTLTIRVGTAGTTSDTARCTAFSTGTGTAAIDWAVIYVTVYATAGGSTATLNCSATLTHQLSATGWSTSAGVQAFSTQTSFDTTPAGTKIGLSFNGGTSLVSTFQSIDVITSNL